MWISQNFQKLQMESLLQSLLSYDISAYFFCFCIYFKFRFAYLAYCQFCAALFSDSHVSIVNIFGCLYHLPIVYVKSSMLCLRCGYCLLLSKIRLITQYPTWVFCGWMTSCDLRIIVWMLFDKYRSKFWFLNSRLVG